MPITLALFDMAATTVDDTINGRPLVLQSFEDSFNAAHVTVPWDVLNPSAVGTRWKSSHSAGDSGGFAGDAQSRPRSASWSTLRPSPAQCRTAPRDAWRYPLFRFLKQRGVFIAWAAVSLAVTQAIAGHLGWTMSALVTMSRAEKRLAPASASAPSCPAGGGLLPSESPVDRVLPDFAYDQVLKVGDTVQDVAEGCNVGALTIAVASGTQSAKTLAEAGPAAVLPSVAELPDWLVTHGHVAHQPAA
jgi:beta-phosphoglucomutase-like phosphatase (HAD superfamily)